MDTLNDESLFYAIMFPRDETRKNHTYLKSMVSCQFIMVKGFLFRVESQL